MSTSFDQTAPGFQHFIRLTSKLTGILCEIRSGSPVHFGPHHPAEPREGVRVHQLPFELGEVREYFGESPSVVLTEKGWALMNEEDELVRSLRST